MINPATGKPAVVEDLYPVFCKELATAGNGQRNKILRYPGRSAGYLQNLPPGTALQSLQSGKSPGHAGEDLL